MPLEELDDPPELEEEEEEEYEYGGDLGGVGGGLRVSHLTAILSVARDRARGMGR